MHDSLCYTNTVLILIAILITIILISTQSSLAQIQYHEAKIEFDYANYFTKKMFPCYDIEGHCNNRPEEIKNAIITVTDPDANKFNESIDRVKVNVWSDTDRKGIFITAFETHVNSGVFEGTVQISEDQSGQNMIHVTDGDTLAAKYIDTTLPAGYNSDSLEVTASSFIGHTGPPLERVPVSSIGVFDKDGNQINKIKVDQQIQIRSDIANPTTLNETFVYIVQIHDKDGFVESLSWLSGVLLPSQAFSPSVSWIPSEAGNYTANVFVWESISNPDALSPPLFADLEVISNSTRKESQMITENFQCKPGYELVIKSSNNSPACVKPSTAMKLEERGWGTILMGSSMMEKDLIYDPKIIPSDFVSEIDNKFFTLVPGTMFVYESKNEEGLEHNEMYVTNKTKDVSGVNTIEVWDRVWLDGELIEETLDWYAQDKVGNVWYFGEDSKEYQEGKVISTKGSWEAGVDGAKPGIIMQANPTIGEPYRQEYYKNNAEDMAQIVGIDESVTVPYGSFTGCLKTKDWSPLDLGVEENKYYCHDVGGVVLEVGINGERVELVEVRTNSTN